MPRDKCIHEIHEQRVLHEQRVRAEGIALLKGDSAYVVALGLADLGV